MFFNRTDKLYFPSTHCRICEHSKNFLNCLSKSELNLKFRFFADKQLSLHHLESTLHLSLQSICTKNQSWDLCDMVIVGGSWPIIRLLSRDAKFSRTITRRIEHSMATCRRLRYVGTSTSLPVMAQKRSVTMQANRKSIRQLIFFLRVIFFAASVLHFLGSTSQISLPKSYILYVRCFFYYVMGLSCDQCVLFDGNGLPLFYTVIHGIKKVSQPKNTNNIFNLTIFI